MHDALLRIGVGLACFGMIGLIAHLLVAAFSDDWDGFPKVSRITGKVLVGGVVIAIALGAAHSCGGFIMRGK